MDYYMDPTTPVTITNEILDFCLEIDSATKPTFIPVKASSSVRFNYCLTDVPEYARKNGGTVKFGWIIWELPQVFVEAEFHAVWANPSGMLIDITPKSHNEPNILFLLDSQRVYQNKLIDNKRKPLVDNAFTRLWLIIEENRFKIREKHFRNGDVADDAIEEFDQWYKSFINKNRKIGRNDPCFCGSGMKFKKCCGKN